MGLSYEWPFKGKMLRRELNFTGQLVRITQTTNNPRRTNAATTMPRFTNIGVTGFPKNARYDKPVPGSPIEMYFLPLESTPTRNPVRPTLPPIPDLLRFARTPGAIRIRRWKRKPTVRYYSACAIAYKNRPEYPFRSAGSLAQIGR
jgi:hypothetical protein